MQRITAAKKSSVAMILKSFAFFLLISATCTTAADAQISRISSDPAYYEKRMVTTTVQQNNDGTFGYVISGDLKMEVKNQPGTKGGFTSREEAQESAEVAQRFLEHQIKPLQQLTTTEINQILEGAERGRLNHNNHKH